MPENQISYMPQPGPRRSVAFIGSECYPFVKTGGLADVMYALPKALSRMNCDVKVILPAMPASLGIPEQDGLPGRISDEPVQ